MYMNTPNAIVNTLVYRNLTFGIVIAYNIAIKTIF